MITIPGKIPISIHPLFWLLALFIGWMSTFTLAGTLLAVLVILISVLFHEFGHALTGVAFGQQTRIELAVFGGFTYRQGRKLKLWEEFLVVLNGPLAGLLLCGIAYLTLKTASIENPPLLFVLKFTYLVNLFWTFINLIPVLPLDGGHLLSIVLEGIFGFRGVKIAIVTGLVIASCITIFFFVIGYWLVGALFLILTFESFRSLKYYRLLSEKDRDAELQKVLKLGQAASDGGDEIGALEKYKEVREKTKGGVLYTMATQEMALIYKRQGRIDEAYQLLRSIKKHLSNENQALFHLLAYQNKDYKMVAELSNATYQISPNYNTALINALSFGALGQAKPSIGWFECAMREGLPAPKQAIDKSEFDPIRSEPTFEQFTNSLDT